MALFGAPIAHEDHPHRGLRAALKIHRDLQPLREDVRRAHDVDFRVQASFSMWVMMGSKSAFLPVPRSAKSWSRTFCGIQLRSFT